MRVHLIKKQTIEDYAEEHASSRDSFKGWISMIKFADWETPEDIQTTFPTADLLGKGSDRVVFNIAGNSHRMICRYYFRKRDIRLYVCWLGTHAEYNKLCHKKEQYTVSDY